MTGLYYNRRGDRLRCRLLGKYSKNKHIRICPSPALLGKVYFNAGQCRVSGLRHTFLRRARRCYTSFTRHFPKAHASPVSTARRLSPILRLRSPAFPIFCELSSPRTPSLKRVFRAAINRVGTERLGRLAILWQELFFCNPRGLFGAKPAATKTNCGGRPDLEEISRSADTWAFLIAIAGRVPYGEIIAHAARKTLAAAD